MTIMGNVLCYGVHFVCWLGIIWNEFKIKD